MKQTISIIGLGYVGLPLAVAFSKYFKVIGYDISKNRVAQLKNGFDSNKEFSRKKINLLKNLKVTNQIQKTRNSEIFIITVPTPIFKNKLPNLNFLKKACEQVAKNIKYKSTIIFESTVYPGCTENFCVPIIEKISKKKLNTDFFVGYSPERINVGDKKHGLENITKIVSASNNLSLKKISKLYSKIIKSGVHQCKNIKTAEAAKAIENAQRDINIAFINEVGNIFSKLNIGLHEVLEAANTKWNFLNFKPGLVGGHCIGVDPYYLTYCAKKIGFNPKLINAGRNTNDNMPLKFADFFYKSVKKNFDKKKKINLLVLGLSFKENTNDIRNSKVFDLAKYLRKKGSNVDIYDPLIDEKIENKNFKFLNCFNLNKKYHGIFFAVPHNIIVKNFNRILKSTYKNSIIFDLKNILKNSKFSKKNILKF